MGIDEKNKEREDMLNEIEELTEELNKLNDDHEYIIKESKMREVEPERCKKQLLIVQSTNINIEKDISNLNKEIDSINNQLTENNVKSSEIFKKISEIHIRN